MCKKVMLSLVLDYPRKPLFFKVKDCRSLHKSDPEQRDSRWIEAILYF